MKSEYKCTCSRENLENIRQFVVKQLDPVSISQSRKDQIVLAIDEACANAIIHGNKADESKEILIVISINDNLLEVEISDIGPNEISYVEGAGTEIKQLIKERKKGGLGLKLMHSIMDEVIFTKVDGRNVCKLQKNIK